MAEETFLIIMMSIVSTTFIVCLPVVLFFWLVVRKRSNRGMSGNEEDKLRHIWSGLQRMERRIENLEAILAPGRRSDPLQDATRGEDVRTGRFDT